MTFNGTKLVALLVGAAFVASLTPSIAGAAAATHRYRIEELEADFVLTTEKEGSYLWIGVAAKRVTNLDTGAIKVTGYPIRGTCEGDETGFNISCYGTGLSGWQVTRFDADAGMNLGLLVMKRGDRKIRMTFTGNAPYPTVTSTNENNCGGTTTDVYVLSRNATAEGRLLGRDVSTAMESDGNRAAESMNVIDRTRECA